MLSTPCRRLARFLVCSASMEPRTSNRTLISKRPSGWTQVLTMSGASQPTLPISKRMSAPRFQVLSTVAWNPGSAFTMPRSFLTSRLFSAVFLMIMFFPPGQVAFSIWFLPASRPAW